MKRAEAVHFLGVWIEEGLGWRGQIEKVRTKVGQLLGVLGRAGAVLGGSSLLSLYNGLVLPHLQYCLMVWGDFQGARNGTLAGSLLRYQKRFAGLVAGKRGLYHSDPLFAQFGMHGWRPLPAAAQGPCLAFLEWPAAGRSGCHAGQDC